MSGTMRAFTPACGNQRVAKPARISACNVAKSSQQAPQVDRRALLLSVAGGVVLSGSQLAPAQAVSEVAGLDGYVTYFGAASPPTSYGGYGGNVNEAPKYSFERPADWKMQVVNKVQKGTAGIDSITYNPKAKTTNKAFVVQLARAGEDNKSFRLGDFETTFYSFSGADSDIQDALETSPLGLQAVERRTDKGQVFYDYILESPSCVYRATITTAFSKVFAFMVRSSPRQWATDREQMDRMMYSFTTLNQN